MNPLLEAISTDTAADTGIPFDRMEGAHVEPAIRELLAEAEQRLHALVSDPAPRTYESTLGALERMTERLERAMGIAEHLESVATTPALREAFNAVQPAVSEFFSKIPLDEGAWRALKAFAATPEANALTGPQARFLKKTVDDFKRNGADLDPAGKKRLAEIDVELAKLTLKFSQNVLDSSNEFEVLVGDEKKLAGLPPGAIAAARESAQQKGLEGYRLTLQMPSYLPVMTYCHDASIREKLYRGQYSRAVSGEHDNLKLIGAILGLRREKARLLGFSHFADFVLEDRMAKRGDAARKFLETLREKAESAFESEAAELAEFRRSQDGPDAASLEAWDVAYWAERMRRAKLDYDEEALRPYFALERVLEGLFATAERLYGVKIEPVGARGWDPSVRAYAIREAGGRRSSMFYVDVFPRENKRDGAWMHGLVTSPFRGDASAPHVEVLAGNMTPPLGDKPALLNHREVETLFHEFGHLMHHASSRVAVRSLAGTNVAWDFVELPSQIMENWCWEREALDLFARHVDTGETIPDEILQRMRAARSFRAATQMMRQIGFAEVDLALHMDWDPARDGDAATFARNIFALYSPVPLPHDYAMIASFGHLFGSPVGYAAGYYSYKWAEVLDADAFSRFKREGLFNREVGRSFRENILSRGDSEDPGLLYRKFMGRDPTLDALLERDGLRASKSP